MTYNRYYWEKLEWFINEDTGWIVWTWKNFGATCKKEINEDGLRTSKSYKYISLAKSVSCSSWLDERNTLLTSFVMGLSGADIRNENEKKLNVVTHAVHIMQGI